MSFPRVCLLLMDSCGVGASLDANLYGDAGANTFVHIVEACNEGRADISGVRKGPLNIPNLTRAGIYHSAIASCGKRVIDLATLTNPCGLYGYAVEQSLGKDTPSGHWELMGVPVNTPWGYFSKNITEDNIANGIDACFPAELLDEFVNLAKLPGVLAKKHASGTDVIQEFGEEHMRTGAPIVYTSADSVFQIAAHEESFGLQRLYDICIIARQLVDKYQIARVIARPFVSQLSKFVRTANRRDYATLPPELTLLDYLKAAGRAVVAIGKTEDIFAEQGITQTIKAAGNMALFDATMTAMQTLPAGGMIFTNLVDFDSSYGHRRDVAGYAHALEEFDARLVELNSILAPTDLVVITADHGCDPTYAGTDHTREHIPVLMYGPTVHSRFIGRRDTFADVGQTLANYLKINPLLHGVSFL